MIPKPLSLIILVFLIVLPNFALGWFVDGIHSRPFSTRMSAIPPVPSNSLAVYDDIASGSEGVVMQPTPFFVPVDTVDLDIPLTLLVKTPVSSMEALDRLMVANLRLKLLIDEYNALQKKADQLLKSVSIPYLDSPWITPETKDYKSLDDRKKSLDTRLTGILIEVPGGSKSQSSSVNLPLPLPILSSGRIPGGAYTLLPPPGALTSKDLTSRQNNDIAFSERELVPVGPGVASKDLPWVFAVFLKVSSYCLSHRLETVIYGVTLFFFGYLIVLQTRHGK